MEWMRIRGARTHNLRGLDLDIPQRRLVAFSGVSGSGKSSLVFDTIYAEGRRRYIESLSSYARQLIGQLAPADVDAIEGLAPAIAVDQQQHAVHPRSTVGTVCEGYDLLRVLFAQAGSVSCPQCATPLRRWSVQQMIDAVLAMPDGRRIALLAPLPSCTSAELAQRLDSLRLRGFVRVRLDGEIVELDAVTAGGQVSHHQVDVVVDRLILRRDADGQPMTDRVRLSDSIETALSLSGGTLTVLEPGAAETVYSRVYRCAVHGLQWGEQLTARHFSFFHPVGACPNCEGLGVRPAGTSGTDEPRERALQLSAQPCPTCHGERLQPALRAVRFRGSSIGELSARRIDQLADWVQAAQADHQLSPRERAVAEPVLRQLAQRLGLLREIGLDYLTFDRSAVTLSGGEYQRLRLATQLGSGLSGVLYVLDEPSSGLHPADAARLQSLLHRLRDLGNSVLVVEHDPDILRAADWVVDIGPGAGRDGGELLYSGPPQGLFTCERSVTAPFLRGEWPDMRGAARGPAEHWIELEGCTLHNLQHVAVRIPLQRLVGVSGVSGSGKSSLILETLYPLLAQRLHRAQLSIGPYQSVSGIELIDRVIVIDRAPLGRSARSNPATAVRLFDAVRQLFAATGEARARGYDTSRFSFNVKGGRCEHCLGEGLVHVDMQFMPDVYVTCEHCGGSRYNRETLDIRYRGATIADVLAFTVGHAARFFSAIPTIAERLQLLIDVGLDYLTLGQPAHTLSGGEAQRIKLAAELARRSVGHTLYILDEPTGGLHPADTVRLLSVLQRLVDAGNSMVVVEHDPAVLMTADWLIDIGPGAGPAGGRIVAVGTPAQVSTEPLSVTGHWLARWRDENRT